MPTIMTTGGELEYQDEGRGAPLVFVAGVYVNGPALWQDVVDELKGTFRCIVPLLPLGGHHHPMPNADLTPPGVVTLILELIEMLGLHQVTLVGSNTGGGLCLISLNSTHPGRERVTRLVLANCDSFEHFPPEGFGPMVQLARQEPDEASARFGERFASDEGKREFVAGLAGRELGPERLQALTGPMADNAPARLDAMHFTGDLDPAPMLAATPALEAFDGPVLLVWGDDDTWFPAPHGRRLASTFQHATLHTVPESKCFVMLDAPEQMVAAMRVFLDATSAPS